jgi:hypothetical protein
MNDRRDVLHTVLFALLFLLLLFLLLGTQPLAAMAGRADTGEIVQ